VGVSSGKGKHPCPGSESYAVGVSAKKHGGQGKSPSRHRVEKKIIEKTDGSWSIQITGV